jgi:hypothetical protein
MIEIRTDQKSFSLLAIRKIELGEDLRLIVRQRKFYLAIESGLVGQVVESSFSVRSFFKWMQVSSLAAVFQAAKEQNYRWTISDLGGNELCVEFTLSRSPHNPSKA